MADPVIVPIVKDTWTLVALNQTTGMIHILDTSPDSYAYTYRHTGETAPANPATDNEAVPFNPALQISAALGIDVYVMTKGKNGSVRADL